VLDGDEYILPCRPNTISCIRRRARFFFGVRRVCQGREMIFSLSRFNSGCVVWQREGEWLFLARAATNA